LFTYVRVYGSLATPHVLPWYVPNKLLAGDFSYQTVGDGLTKTLKESKKPLCPSFSLQYNVYALHDFRHAVGFNPVQKLPAYEFLNKENKQCESITHKTHMHRDFSLDPKTGTTSLIFHYIPFNVTIHIYTCRSIQYHGPKNHRVQYHVRKSCTKP